MKKNLLLVLPIMSLLSITGCSNKPSGATLVPPSSNSGCQTTISVDTGADKTPVEDTWYDGQYLYSLTSAEDEAIVNIGYINKIDCVTKFDSETTYHVGHQEDYGVFNNSHVIGELKYSLSRYSDSVVFEKSECGGYSIGGVATNYPAETNKSIYYKTDKNITAEGNTAFAQNYYQNGKLVYSGFCTELPEEALADTFTMLAFSQISSSSTYWSILDAEYYESSCASSSVMHNKSILFNQNGDFKIVSNYVYLSSVDYNYNGNQYEYTVFDYETFEYCIKKTDEFGYVYTGMKTSVVSYAVGYTLNSSSETVTLDEPIFIGDYSIETNVNYSKTLPNNPNLPVYDERLNDVYPSEYLKVQIYDQDTDSYSDYIVGFSTLDTTLDERVDNPDFDGFTYTLSTHFYAGSSLYTLSDSNGEVLTDLVNSGILRLSKTLTNSLQLVEVNEKLFFKISSGGRYYFDITTNADGEVVDIFVHL